MSHMQVENNNLSQEVIAAKVNDIGRGSPMFTFHSLDEDFVRDSRLRKIRYDRESLISFRARATAITKPNCFLDPNLEYLMKHNVDFTKIPQLPLTDPRKTEELRKHMGYGPNCNNSHLTYGHRNHRDNHHRDQRDNRDRKWNFHNHRNRGVEEEPEWYSEGPMTQNDKVELTGFDDDRRGRTTQLAKKNDTKLDSAVPKDIDEKVNEPEVDNLLDKILGADNISSIFPNGLPQQEESLGSSRFSRFFQRGSDNAQQNGTNISGRNERNGILESLALGRVEKTFDKPELKVQTAKDIEVALRNLLLSNPTQQKPEPTQAPVSAKPKENVVELKNLLQQIMVKGENNNGNHKATFPNNLGANVPPPVPSPAGSITNYGPPPGLRFAPHQYIPHPDFLPAHLVAHPPPNFNQMRFPPHAQVMPSSYHNIQNFRPMMPTPNFGQVRYPSHGPVPPPYQNPPGSSYYR